jgi:hypothetical protein
MGRPITGRDEMEPITPGTPRRARRRDEHLRSPLVGAAHVLVERLGLAMRGEHLELPVDPEAIEQLGGRLEMVLVALAAQQNRNALCFCHEIVQSFQEFA